MPFKESFVSLIYEGTIFYFLKKIKLCGSMDIFENSVLHLLGQRFWLISEMFFATLDRFSESVEFLVNLSSVTDFTKSVFFS